jgi:hypothetical protein
MKSNGTATLVFAKEFVYHQKSNGIAPIRSSFCIQDFVVRRKKHEHQY